MANPKLEVRLADNTLSVNGEIMSLDDSLFDAKPFKKEKALDLIYRKEGEDFSCNEAENIYRFLEQKGLYEEDIQISFCPDFVPTTVSLVGEFDAVVYK